MTISPSGHNGGSCRWIATLLLCLVGMAVYGQSRKGTTDQRIYLEHSNELSHENPVCRLSRAMWPFVMLVHA